MKLFRRLKDYIFQDVKNENETKKAAVMMRCTALFFCVFFLGATVIFALTGVWAMALFSFFFIGLYSAAFHITYLGHTRFAYNYLNILTLFWIACFVVILGWDCGVQHFLYVALIFFCMVIYASKTKKVLFALGILFFRLSLYFYTHTHAPFLILPFWPKFLMQLICSMSLVCMLTNLALLFSQDSLEMEQKLIKYNKKIELLANMDPLTKLLNRRAASAKISKMCRHEGSEGQVFNLAIGDIDFFKKVNDTYGHEAGDEVLKGISAIFTEFMENKGFAARWGGEEFLLVFQGMNGDNAMFLLENLRLKIEKSSFACNDNTLKVTMTFGLEEYDHRRNIEENLARADEKLYIGKTSGRNQVVY